MAQPMAQAVKAPCGCRSPPAARSWNAAWKSFAAGCWRLVHKKRKGPTVVQHQPALHFGVREGFPSGPLFFKRIAHRLGDMGGNCSCPFLKFPKNGCMSKLELPVLRPAAGD